MLRMGAMGVMRIDLAEVGPQVGDLMWVHRGLATNLEFTELTMMGNRRKACPLHLSDLAVVDRTMSATREITGMATLGMDASLEVPGGAGNS